MGLVLRIECVGLKDHHPSKSNGIVTIAVNTDMYLFQTKLLFIGASLSKPHTSVTAFAEVVCMSACGHIP